MELGGNIELLGFEGRDEEELVVIKKIVGNFTKDVSHAHEDFQSLTLSLDGERLAGTLLIGDTEHAAEHTDSNIFFALDAVLKDLEQQAGQ